MTDSGISSGSGTGAAFERLPGRGRIPWPLQAVAVSGFYLLPVVFSARQGMANWVFLCMAVPFIVLVLIRMWKWWRKAREAEMALQELSRCEWEGALPVAGGLTEDGPLLLTSGGAVFFPGGRRDEAQTTKWADLNQVQLEAGMLRLRRQSGETGYFRVKRPAIWLAAAEREFRQAKSN